MPRNIQADLVWQQRCNKKGAGEMKLRLPRFFLQGSNELPHQKNIANRIQNVLNWLIGWGPLISMALLKPVQT